jgi:hypothetical protein
LGEQQRFRPGTPAPEAGWYAELDEMGIPTNTWVSMALGELLPANPGGDSWRQVAPTTQAKRERGPADPKPRGDIGRLHTSLVDADDPGGLPASTD